MEQLGLPPGAWARHSGPVSALKNPMPRPRFARSGDAMAFFAPGFARLARESLRVAHLDRERRLIGVRLCYSELCDAVEFPFRTIIADALALGGEGIVLAHNHPSGDPSPSAADLDVTRILADLARPLGIRLHDHLIFANGKWRSLRALGLM